MALLNFIKKRYILITCVLIILGLIIDLVFTDAIPIKTSQTIEDLTGHSTSFDIFVFSYKYEILKIISSLCYGLAISILVLLALEIKYDDLEKEKHRVLEETERASFKKDIQELQGQININVFDGVLKKLIPEELFNLITRDILNKSVLRQNAHWVYDVTEGSKDNYIVTQTIAYELVNIGKSTISEPLTVSIVESSRCKSYFNFFKVEKAGNIITQKNKAEIESELNIVGNKKIKKYAIELNPDEVVKVTLNIVNEYIDKNVFDSHNTNYSIIGLSIEVNKPEDCDFNLHPSFTTPLNPTIPSDKKIMYEKIPGILIGQGLVYAIQEK